MNYTVNQLAIRWSCSGAHIRKLIADRKLAAFRIGSARGYRIKADEVERWEAQQAMKSPSDVLPAIGLPVSIM